MLLSLLLLLALVPADNQSATLTATPTAVAGIGGPTIRVDGSLTVPAGHAFAEIKLEVGTLKNGEFAPAVPKIESILTLDDLRFGDFSHTFAGKVAVGSYGVRATAKGAKPGVFVNLRWSKSVDPIPTVEVK